MRDDGGAPAALITSRTVLRPVTVPAGHERRGQVRRSQAQCHSSPFDVHSPLLSSTGREAAPSPPGPHGTYETRRRLPSGSSSRVLQDQYWRSAWEELSWSLALSWSSRLSRASGCGCEIRAASPGPAWTSSRSRPSAPAPPSRATTTCERPSWPVEPAPIRSVPEKQGARRNRAPTPAA